jgi:hypothetical protein
VQRGGAGGGLAMRQVGGKGGRADGIRLALVTIARATHVSTT